VGRYPVLAFVLLALGACAPETTEPQIVMNDPICAATADARARDAAYSGYGGAMQDQIRAHTYRNCREWAAKSGSIGFH
jgi:hypothetical protein